MNYSRRDLALLIPMLAATQAKGPVLESKQLRFEDLPVRATGDVRIREMLKGDTHTGFLIDLHVTELAAGGRPHAPHHHPHEEMLLVVDGAVTFTINGNEKQLGAGSVAYVASNAEHGLRNAGSVPAKYFVLALGRDKD